MNETVMEEYMDPDFEFHCPKYHDFEKYYRKANGNTSMMSVASSAAADLWFHSDEAAQLEYLDPFQFGEYGETPLACKNLKKQNQENFEPHVNLNTISLFSPILPQQKTKATSTTKNTSTLFKNNTSKQIVKKITVPKSPCLLTSKRFKKSHNTSVMNESQWNQLKHKSIHSPFEKSTLQKIHAYNTTLPSRFKSKPDPIPPPQKLPLHHHTVPKEFHFHTKDRVLQKKRPREEATQDGDVLFKARRIGDTVEPQRKIVLVKKSVKPLTVPRTPNLYTSQRYKLREIKKQQETTQLLHAKQNDTTKLQQQQQPHKPVIMRKRIPLQQVSHNSTVGIPFVRTKSQTTVPKPFHLSQTNKSKVM